MIIWGSRGLTSTVGSNPSGVYTYLRHPSEWGLLMIAFGAPLSLGLHFTAVAGLLILAPFSVWRMRREDKVLMQHGRSD